LKGAAVRSLARFPTLEVREALLKTLREEDSARVKASILSALAAGGDLSALHPVLRAGLDDPDPRVRANAVESIGLTLDPALLADLRPKLTGEAPRVMANAIVALARIPEERHAAIEALRRMFETQDRSQRLSALYAAGEVREPALARAIRVLVGHPDIDLHRNAVIALGKHDALEAVEPLCRLLVGPIEHGRAAALVLDRLGPEVREALIERLCQVSVEEREQAVRALRSCGLNYPDELEQLEAAAGSVPRSHPVILDVAAART
jgi:HEAT repeat protein